jgi:hypothetical protein
MSSVDEALQRVAAAGFRLNNLFQRADGPWQANVVAPNGFGVEFGRAATPAAALHIAMANAHKYELGWLMVMQGLEAATKALRRINDAMEAQNAEQL